MSQDCKQRYRYNRNQSVYTNRLVVLCTGTLGFHTQEVPRLATERQLETVVLAKYRQRITEIVTIIKILKNNCSLRKRKWRNVLSNIAKIEKL